MEEVQKSKNFIIKYKYKILLAIGALLALIGIILLGTSSTQTNIKTEIKDYTHCEKAYDDQDPTTCFNDLSEGSEKCFCKIEMNITQPMLGQVILYYELTDFKPSAEYINSRDDDQLKGVVSETPSEKCEPFRYLEIDGVKKPIVPCGEIADGMFTDDFSLTLKESWMTVPLQRFGMLTAEDKSGFQNPENLKQAFQNFSKPKSWKRHIWELDTNNEDNNGFQNEAFISWMRTDWKRKPIARLNQTDPTFENGLPAGIYEIVIIYNYPPSKYNGSRLLILQSISSVSSKSSCTGGVILLVLGLLMLIAGAKPNILTYIKKIKNRHQETVVKPSESNTANLQGQSEAPFLNQS